MKLNHSAQIRLDTVSENCIFYTSTTYEFSHSFGPNPEILELNIFGPLTGLRPLLLCCEIPLWAQELPSARLRVK